MPPGACTIRQKLPPNRLPNSGSPLRRQRSDNPSSSGPSLRLRRATLPARYRGGGSENRGEGVGSYLPPAHTGSLFLHALVDCSSARKNSRSAAAARWARGVCGGTRPLGGSTIIDVRAPVCLMVRNVVL